MKYYVIYRGKVHNKGDHYWVEVGVSTSLRHVLAQADEHGQVDYSEHDTMDDAEVAWRTHCAAQAGTNWVRAAGMDVVAARKAIEVSQGTVHVDGRHLAISKDTNTTLF